MRDDDGKVTGLIVKQGQREGKAAKIGWAGIQSIEL